MSEVIKYRGTTSASNPTGVTEVSETDPLPTTLSGVAAPTADADGDNNTRTDLATSSRISGFNGTTWDRLRAGITAVTSTLKGWLNTLPWAVYNATPTVRTEGQGGPLQADANGNIKMAEQYEIPGGDSVNDVMKVEERFSTTYISTATTTVVKGSAGFLHAITIGETAAGTISIYDNATGAGTVINVLKASIAEQTFVFDCVFAAGLTIITAAASKLSVSWR